MTDSEDIVSYWLYPTNMHSIKCPITTLAKVCTAVSTLTSTWVWHRQEFSLRVVEEGGTWHLAGATCYGENVMDEWFIVSLLREISIQFSGLVCRVVDSDGEILLIEAAEYLPSWAGEPSIASGRVYLAAGCVHIIPVCSHPGLVTPIPAVTPPPSICAQVVASYPALTKAREKVQDAIKSRLDNMPVNQLSNHHTCTIPLPKLVGRLLARNKNILARIVQAVVERDMVDLRSARTMSNIRQMDVDKFSVKFSRCLYAMISSCKVRPSKGSNWVVGEDRSELVGYKLALGVEMLLARARDCEKGTLRGKEWKKFLSKLVEVGYFQGELEGSRKYKTLEEGAEKFWSNTLEEDAEDDIRQLVKVAEDSNEAISGAIIGPSGVSDSEDWLEVTPESLDKMLEAQFGMARDATGQNIPEEVNKFLNKMSDMAGVEHEDGMKFDPENMVESMKKLMGEMKDGGGDMFDSDSDSETDSGEEDPVMMDYMQRLDSEVLGKEKGRQDMPDIDKPLDVDASVLSNLLASYSAQTGLGGHGPASSLLQSIRVNPGRPEDT